ncbi:MAG: hypothetical protein JWN79_356 [Gemmatimonadetes bacterium]|jgi:hypothetical protein|nr:hypothetical protein [Gemmatimonadota bacterium]
MGCIARLGCLVVLAILALAGWLTRDRWMHNLPGKAPAVATAPAEQTWQPLTPAAAERGRRAIAALDNPKGPVFANLSAAEITAYVSQAAGRMLPASADSVEAAVIGDQILLRAIVPMKDIAGSGVLGPLGGLLNARERITLGGTFHVVRPGLSEFQVRTVKLREFNVPGGAIPRLVQQITKGKRTEGVAQDALPVPTPRNLADVRIANGRVTLYKTTGARP